ncbi:MAG TPA: cell wall hydrolase [Sphingobium sp.]|nr:cell wall hydrolase [Sphingobium sp.]
MRHSFLVAGVAAVGLLSSTLALAEVTDGSVNLLKAPLEAPVVVDQGAAPLTVEPDNQISPTTAQLDDESAAPTAATLADLVHAWDVDDLAEMDQETRCLATAVFYEARSESLAGQLAVAHVVIERAKSGRFPSSLCGVVTQPGQFSFVRAGRLPDAPTSGRQWRTAAAIAEIAQEESWANPVEGALYFHAARVSPGWNRPRVTRIGGHIFYR